MFIRTTNFLGTSNFMCSYNDIIYRVMCQRVSKFRKSRNKIIRRLDFKTKIFDLYRCSVAAADGNKTTNY